MYEEDDRLSTLQPVRIWAEHGSSPSKTDPPPLPRRHDKVLTSGSFLVFLGRSRVSGPCSGLRCGQPRSDRTHVVAFNISLSAPHRGVVEASLEALRRRPKCKPLEAFPNPETSPRTLFQLCTNPDASQVSPLCKPARGAGHGQFLSDGASSVRSGRLFLKGGDRPLLAQQHPIVLES